MKRLVQFELDENTTFCVEVDAEPGDEERVGRRGDEIDRAGDRHCAREHSTGNRGGASDLQGDLHSAMLIGI